MSGTPSLWRHAPPAALYYASRDRRHEHPVRHLQGFTGILQADAYGAITRFTIRRASRVQSRPHCAGYAGGSSSNWPTLPPMHDAARTRGISPVALRRSGASTYCSISSVASTALRDERLRIRKERSAPVLAELESWLREQRSRMSRSASVAGPIDYMLKRWNRFTRFIEDGSICLTNNALSAPCADLHWDANHGSLPAPIAEPNVPRSWSP